MSELYKGILLNKQGDAAPNGDIETAVLKELIDRTEAILAIIGAGNAGDIAMFTGATDAPLGASALKQTDNIVVGDFYDVLRLHTEESVSEFGVQITNAATGQTNGTRIGVRASGDSIISSLHDLIMESAEDVTIHSIADMTLNCDDVLSILAVECVMDTDSGVQIRGATSEKTVVRVSNNRAEILGEEDYFIEIGLNESNNEPFIRHKGYDDFYIEDYITGVEFPKSWLRKSGFNGIKLGYDSVDTETTPVDITIDGADVNVICDSFAVNGSPVGGVETGSFTLRMGAPDVQASFSGTLDLTVQWNKSGNLVTLYIPAFSGIATGMGFHSYQEESGPTPSPTDIPLALRPPVSQQSPCVMMVSSTNIFYAAINSLGYITFNGNTNLTPGAINISSAVLTYWLED